MFWGKKEEKKSLPDLPPLRPRFPEENEAIEERSMPSFPEIPERRIKEIEESDVMIQRAIETHPDVLSTLKGKTTDVFVKIDRFHSARKALDTARTKLGDMDILLKKIREVRMREEQELSSWEKEVDLIKTKVEEVTRNIFEKIE